MSLRFFSDSCGALKPHIWREGGSWRCGYSRNALIRFGGSTPYNAWLARECWLTKGEFYACAKG